MKIMSIKISYNEKSGFRNLKLIKVFLRGETGWASAVSAVQFCKQVKLHLFTPWLCNFTRQTLESGKSCLVSKLKVRQSRNDFFKPTFPPKTERTNSILLLWDLFLFVFWRKLKAPKRHFEINWPSGLVPTSLSNIKKR